MSSQQSNSRKKERKKDDMPSTLEEWKFKTYRNLYTSAGLKVP